MEYLFCFTWKKPPASFFSISVLKSKGLTNLDICHLDCLLISEVEEKNQDFKCWGILEIVIQQYVEDSHRAENTLSAQYYTIFFFRKLKMVHLLIPIADTTYVVLCRTNKKTIQSSLILVDMLWLNVQGASLYAYISIWLSPLTYAKNLHK